MAEHIQVSPDTWFKGCDHDFEVEVRNKAQTACLDITGWTLSWKLSRRKGSPVLLTKTTTSGITIAGTFNADPASNGQLAIIDIADTDTDSFASGIYWMELKRMDDGVEAILLHGWAPLEHALHTS